MSAYFEDKMPKELIRYLEKQRTSRNKGGQSLTRTYMDLYKSGDIPDNLRFSLIDNELSPPKSEDPNQNKQSPEAKKEQDINAYAVAFDAVGDFVDWGTGGWRPALIGYEKSLTGAARTALVGGPKFEELYGEDGQLIDVGIYEDIFSTLASFSMPLDWLTFKTGKIIGNKAEKRFNRVFDKKVQNAAKNVPISTPAMIRSNAIRGAFPLAFYEGAHGAIHASIEGKDGWGILAGAARGMVRGSILGSVTSGVSGGFLGRRAKIALKSDNPGTWKHLKNLAFGDKLAWGFSSKVGQIATEGLGFTVGGNLLDMAPVLGDGRDVRWDTFGQDLLDNTLLFVALKGKHKVYEKIGTNSRKARDYFVKKYEDGKVNSAIKNVQKDVQDRTPSNKSNEILEDQLKKLSTEIADSNKKHSGLAEELGEMINSVEKIKVALKKPKKEFASEHLEAFENLHNLDYKIETFIEDFKEYKESLDPKNRVDRANLEDIIESFETIKEEATQIRENNNKIVNDYLGITKEKTDLAKELQAEFMAGKTGETPFVLTETGKKVEIFGEEGLRKDVTKEQLEGQLSAIKLAKGDISEKASFKPIEKEIVDLKEHSLGRDLPDSKLKKDIIDRRKELASGPYVEGVKDVGGKDVLQIKSKGNLNSVQRGLFENSSLFIRDMIQNHYPDALPEGGKGLKKVGGKKSLMDVETAKNHVRQIRDFAEWLAVNQKDFTTMEKKDVQLWLGTKGETYRWATSALLQNLQTKNRTARMKGKVITDSVDAIKPESDLARWTGAIMTRAEQELAVGARRGHVQIEQGIIAKPTTKKGVFKRITMSAPFKNIMKKLIKKAEEFKGGALTKEDHLFLDTNGTKLYQSDINTIAENIMGGKKGVAGKPQVSARAFRSLFSTWAEIKDSAPGLKKDKLAKKVKLSYYDILDVFGLGHGDPKKGRKYLRERYGLTDTQIESMIESIKKEFDADIKNHISGKKKLNKLFNEKAPEKYTLVEVVDKLKEITKPGAPLDYTFRNTKHSTKTSPVERKYSKNTIEGVFRWMIENPSRLIEVAPKDPKTKKEFLEELSSPATDKIKETGTAWKSIEAQLENKGALKDLNPVEKIKTIKENLLDKEVVDKAIKERNKSHPDYKEKVSWNQKNRPIEARLKKSGVDINSLRMKVFGTKDYKLSPEHPLEQFKEYNKLLTNESSFNSNPYTIKEALDKTLFPEKGAKKIAEMLGQKDGDYTKIKGGKVHLFLDLIEDYSSIRGSKYSGPSDVRLDKDFLHQIKDGIRGKTEQNIYSSWILVNRLLKGTNYAGVKIRKPAKGAPKKALQVYEEFLSGFETTEGMIKYPSQREFNRINKKIRKLMGSSYSTNSYWLNPSIMEHMIKKLKSKNLDEGLRKKYEKEYNKNKQAYEDSLRPGTIENIIKKEFKNLTDNIWEKFESAVKTSNKDIKGTTAYKEIMETLKKMKLEYYVPQIHSKEGRLALFNSTKFTQKVDKILDKKIKKDVETSVDRRLYKNKPKLRNKSLGDKLLDKSKGGYSEVFEKLLERKRGDDKWIAKEKGKIEKKLYNAYNNADFSLESSRFMERGEQSDLFQKVNSNGKSKIIKSYESDLFSLMVPYISSSSKFIANITHAKDYISRRFVKDDASFGVKRAMEIIERYDMLKGKGKTGGETYKYLESLRKEVMGTQESKISETWQAAGNIGALAGLSSFAEPGIKNFIQGQIQIMAQTGLENYGRNMFRLIDRTRWRKAKERAEEVGAVGTIEREFVGGKAAKYVQEGIYRWNWMNKTESINRVVALESARMSLFDAIDGMTSVNTSERKKKEMEDWIRNTGRFTDKDMKMIKSGEVFKETPESIKKWERLMDKFDTFSHRATQGGVYVTDVPKWMTGRAKPFFLFQRIATSLTATFARNVIRPAIKYGNFTPLAVYLSASSFGGATLNQIKSFLYSSSGPVSLSDDALDEMLYNLWRVDGAMMYGSMLDIVPGSGWNPYQETNTGGDAINQAMPFILSKGAVALDNLIQYSSEYKDGKQALGDWAKETFVVANQMDRMSKLHMRWGPGYTDGDQVKHTKSKDYQHIQEAFNFRNQYKKMQGLSRPRSEWGGSKRKSYYRNVQEALYFGTDEEIAREFWYAWSEIENQLKIDDNALGSDYEALTDKARAQKVYDGIFNSLAHMNPIHLSDETTDRKLSEEQKYFKWLKFNHPDAHKHVITAERIYKFKMRKLIKIATDPSYRDKYSPYANETFKDKRNRLKSLNKK